MPATYTPRKVACPLCARPIRRSEPACKRCLILLEGQRLPKGGKA